jgi:hypothetical protein
MSFSRKEKDIIEKALAYWKADTLIDAQLAERLKENLPVKGFDWKSLAYYASIFALLSLVIAVISIFADEALLQLLDSLISSSYRTKTIVTLAISTLFYFLDLRLTNQDSLNKRYSKEVYALLAAIFLAITAGMLSFSIGTQESPGILVLTLSICYLILGRIHQKAIYWFFGLAALLFAYGTISLELGTTDDTFLGMNYPMRFTLFGLLLIGVSFIGKSIIQPFYEYTYNTAVIIFFAALWILSITGNYNSYQDWLQVKQYELWVYSLLLFSVSFFAVIIGLKKEDEWLKNTAILFILLNLYSRYFEYFWDTMHKAIFFLIIAISFWLLGKQAERLWNKKS